MNITVLPQFSLLSFYSAYVYMFRGGGADQTTAQPIFMYKLLLENGNLCLFGYFA